MFFLVGYNFQYMYNFVQAPSPSIYKSIFSSDLVKSQEWPWKCQKTRNSVDPRNAHMSDTTDENRVYYKFLRSFPKTNLDSQRETTFWFRVIPEMVFICGASLLSGQLVS